MSQATDTTDDEGPALPVNEDTLKDGDSELRFQTGGDLIRSSTALIDPLVDECKLKFEDADAGDNVSVSAVDAANVGMVHLDVPTEAFNSYSTPDGSQTVGVDLSELTNVTDYARKGGHTKKNPGDPVVLLKTGRRVYVQVLPGDKMNRVGSFFDIDPDSMRQSPDIPDLDLPWSGDVDTSRLRDALHGIKGRGFDYVRMTARPTGREGVDGKPTGYLELYAAEKGDADDGGREIKREDGFRTDDPILRYEDDGDAERAVSMFSMDYMKDMVDGLVSAKVETTNVHLGSEFPIKLKFAESRFGFDGQYMLAPRIQSDESERVTAESATWDWL